MIIKSFPSSSPPPPPGQQQLGWLAGPADPAAYQTLPQQVVTPDATLASYTAGHDTGHDAGHGGHEAGHQGHPIAVATPTQAPPAVQYQTISLQVTLMIKLN